MVTPKVYVVCGRSTCKCWVPLADLRHTVCKCGRRFPKDVLLEASLAGAEVEGFTAADEADAEWAAAFRKRAERKAEGNRQLRDKPWFRKNPEEPAAASSQVEQPQNVSEYLAVGNLSLSKEQLQSILSTAKAKGMLSFADDALEWKHPTTSSGHGRHSSQAIKWLI